jgi:hypothetical protein
MVDPCWLCSKDLKKKKKTIYVLNEISDHYAGCLTMLPNSKHTSRGTWLRIQQSIIAGGVKTDPIGQLLYMGGNVIWL